MSEDDLSLPLILTVTPNGARKGKADHPELPASVAKPGPSL